MADGNRGLIPPSDLDAEAVLISTAMLSPQQLDELSGLVKPRDFFADANRRIFEAALEIRASGQSPTLPAIAGFLRDRGTLQGVGGAPYLAQLCDATPASAHPEQFAIRVAEKARQRALIEACQRIAAEGYGDVGDVPAWLQDAEARVYAATQHERADETMSTLGEAAGATLASAQAQAARGRKGITGYSTGLGRLDRQIDGLQRGLLYTLAARPGMGKTGLAVQIAVNIARGTTEQPWCQAQPKRAAVVVSVEMPREQLAARTLAQFADVDATRLARGNLSRQEWKVVTDAAVVCNGIPLVIDEAGTQTAASIRASVRRGFTKIRKRWGDIEPGVIVVDYIQIIAGDAESKRRNRENEISEISGTLRRMAKEFNCPLLMLSQLNRECEKRPDKRPILSDLRDSGSIEQDSFGVLMLFRADQYQDKAQHNGSAEVLVRKIRQGGRCGAVELLFKGETMNFYEPPPLAREYDEFDNVADNSDGQDWRDS